MPDTLGTTTWLAIISTVVKTPGSVTVPSTLTVLVQGSGTESYGLDPTQSQSLSLPTSMYVTRIPNCGNMMLIQSPKELQVAQRLMIVALQK